MAFIDIPTIIDSSTLRLILIYLPNFAWLFAGFVEFAFRSHRWRGALSQAARAKTPKIGDPYHQDLLIYLGAMGGAVALSVVDAAYQDLLLGQSINLHSYLRLWGLVGWSRVKPSERWDWARSMGPITYTDTALTIWDLTLAFWRP